MANIRGGDITQIKIAGREFDPVNDSNVTYRIGKFKNENTPTGNGKLHTKRTRRLPGIESLPISIDPDLQDYEFLQNLADDGVPVPISITLAGGVVYSGDLVIEGDLDANTGDGQVEVTAYGETFEQI